MGLSGENSRPINPVESIISSRNSSNRLVLHFRSLERPMEDGFILELEKNHTYDDVVEKVAQQLDLDDPSKIRLTAHNFFTQIPKPYSIEYGGVDCLLDMLLHFNQISDILYYEVLDIPLPKIERVKNLKVSFRFATKDEVAILNISLPKEITVEDLLEEMKTKVELSQPNAQLRLLEFLYHKIYKIFPLNEKIEKISNQYGTLRAEEIPEEEKNLGPHDLLIHVYHFIKGIAQNFLQLQNIREPFLLVIHAGETLAEIKVHIQKKLQVPDEEFSKRRDVCAYWEQYLGMELSDTPPESANVTNQNSSSRAKPLEIHNQGILAE